MDGAGEPDGWLRPTADTPLTETPLPSNAVACKADRSILATAFFYTSVEA